MTDAAPPNAAQIEYWNTVAGEIWMRHERQLDRQLAPLGLQAMRVLSPMPGERILDIGCGCGQSTLSLAEKVGASGAVTGVDISGPMLGAARARPVAAGAARPEFRQADAQVDDLGQGAFDAAYSRFGVMFFADPVAAFANIRRALKPGGRLVFVCWRAFAENPFMRAPIEAAAPFLPPMPPMDPTAPGPFAFADQARVRSILAEAGFGDIGVDPFDTRIGGGGIEEALELAFRIGPLGAALREHPERAGEAEEAVRRALAAYDTPAGVMMPAAVWIVQARAG